MDYCSTLASSQYDIKIIKLADRINNMMFIAQVQGHEKINRYLKEAEDFYIAYSILPPQIEGYFTKMRQSYEELRRVKITV